MGTDEIGLIIAGAGVLVTGIFSYVIAGANKQSAIASKEAAKAALESAKISKALLESRENEKSQIKKQYIRDLLSIAETMNISLVCMMLESPNWENCLNALPSEMNISNEELGIYFTDDEARVISIAKEQLEKCRNLWFKGDRPNYRVDEGSEKAIQEMQEKINNVINLFNKPR